MAGNTMQAVGQYDTDGKYQPYAHPMKCWQVGQMMLSDFGFPVAERDEYGDWVSPRLKAYGLKSVVEIIEDATDSEAED